MRFSQCPEGGRHRVCVRVGEPAPTIAEEARSNGAELIVLSWNGTFADGHGAVVKELSPRRPARCSSSRPNLSAADPRPRPLRSPERPGLPGAVAGRPSRIHES